MYSADLMFIPCHEINKKIFVDKLENLYYTCNMKQNDVESIKRMADVVMDQIPFPVNSIGYKIALIMIKLNGYYTFTDTMNKKIFITVDFSR